MGGRAGNSKSGYVFTRDVRKSTYEEEHGGVKVIRTRIEYGKQKKKKSK